MNFKFPTPISTLCFIVFLLSFSCSKDNDLLADYVLADAQGADKLITLIVDDKYITTPNTSVILDVLSNDTFDEDSEVKILNTSEPLNGTVEIIDNKTILYTPGQIDAESTVTEEEIEENTSTEVEGTDAVTEEEVDISTEEASTSSEETTDSFTYTVEVVTEDEIVVTEEGNVTVDVTEYGALKAFPSAYGAGANATGGRGGKVIHVTNLNSSGSGSFREAVRTSGSRTIVFDVSGNIDLGGSNINVSGSAYNNLTIAGQTAPKGGITVHGGNLNFESVDNVVVRFMRFRNGKVSGGQLVEQDAVSHFQGNNIIYDHCSVSFGGDEAISFVVNSTTDFMENVTLQRTIVGTSKTGSILGGSSSYLNNTGSISAHYNFYTDISHRTPNVGGNSRFDVINNVVYNWIDKLTNNNGGSPDINMIGNYYKESYLTKNNGPYPNNGNSIQTSNSANPTIYTSGNLRTSGVDGNHWFELDGASPREYNPPGFYTSSRFDLLGKAVPILSAVDAYQSVMANVGANRYFDDNGSVQVYVDSYDSSKISNALNDTPDTYIYNGTNYSASQFAMPNLPNNGRSANYDSDSDGMANGWESAMGLDPNNPNDANEDRNGDGYTNLEDFLNQVDF